MEAQWSCDGCHGNRLDTWLTHTCRSSLYLLMSGDISRAVHRSADMHYILIRVVHKSAEMYEILIRAVHKSADMHEILRGCLQIS